MFHETRLAPLWHRMKLRSPDVCGLPFVSGSTQTVMTPLRMPGLPVTAAPATPTMTAKATTAADRMTLFDGGLNNAHPLAHWSERWTSPPSDGCGEAP